MRSVRSVSTFKKSPLKIPIQFARNFLSARIYWVYLGISESGKGFSRIGNAKGEVITVQTLEPVYLKRIGLRKANMERRPAISLQAFVPYYWARKRKERDEYPVNVKAHLECIANPCRTSDH